MFIRITIWQAFASPARHSSCVRFASSSRTGFANSELEATVTLCREPFGRTSMTSYTRFMWAGFFGNCSGTHTISKNSGIRKGVISCDTYLTVSKLRARLIAKFVPMLKFPPGFPVRLQLTKATAARRSDC